MIVKTEKKYAFVSHTSFSFSWLLMNYLVKFKHSHLHLMCSFSLQNTKIFWSADYLVCKISIKRLLTKPMNIWFRWNCWNALKHYPSIQPQRSSNQWHYYSNHHKLKRLFTGILSVQLNLDNGLIACLCTEFLLVC